MKNIAIVVLLLFVGSSSMIYSLDMKSKEYDFGFTLGYWMSGDVTAGGGTGEKESSFLLRGFVDAYLMPKFAMGAYLNFSPIDQYGYSITMIEFGVSLKPRFFMNDEFAIKPGLNIGYRTLSGEDEEAEADGLGVNLSVEVQKAMETMILSFEGGFLSQPVGGNEWVSISWAPIMYLGVGLTF